MMTDCRWWLSLLSNNRDMSCLDWDDWQWADAAAAEDAIWQPFSGNPSSELDFLDITRNFFQFVSEDDRVESTNDRRFQIKMKCFYQVEIFLIIDEFFE